MQMTVYTCNNRQYEKSTSFPNETVIRCADDLKRAAAFDHVGVKLHNGYRRRDNYVSSDCVMLDLDNGHSDDPSEWKELNDVEQAFPGVPFYAVESRNHNKPKDGKAARPRYHFYFPINPISDVSQYAQRKDQAAAAFPFFDDKAKDPARMFYGVENPVVHDLTKGKNRRLDEYLILFAPQSAELNSFNLTPHEREPVSFGKPLEPGERNGELHRYAYKTCMNGLSFQEVLTLTTAYNDGLSDPLPQGEVDALVQSAFRATGSKEERADTMRRAEMAIELANEKKKLANGGSSLVCLADVEECEPEWLIENYLPKGEITLLAGDGGVGKTFVWCALAAAISSGKRPFLLNNIFSDEPEKEPQKVLYFSSEDSCEAVLRPRLRQSGAKLSNISTVDSRDEDFQRVKLDNGSFLESLLDQCRPALVILDPIQSFLPPKTDMSARNQMRDAMNKLRVLGGKYGSSFLVIVHTNKQSGVFGRKRIADSADLWDIARSVLICGESDNDPQVKYLSQEKNSYGKPSSTVLFRIDGNGIYFVGHCEKRDRDFVLAANKNKAAAPAREPAEQFILDVLREQGETPMRELSALAKEDLISTGTLRRAKEHLKSEGKIQTRTVGHGKSKGTTVYISLVHSTA